MWISCRISSLDDVNSTQWSDWFIYTFINIRDEDKTGFKFKIFLTSFWLVKKRK